MGASARAVTQCLQTLTAPSFIGTAAAFPKALSWEGTILLPWCFVALSALISRTPLRINNLWTGLKDCKVMGCGTSPAQAIITSWHRCVWGRRGSFSKVKSSTSRLSTTSHRTAWISNSFFFVCVCLFVQWFKSHGSMSQFPNISGQSYHWIIAIVLCLVSLFMQHFSILLWFVLLPEHWKQALQYRSCLTFPPHSAQKLLSPLILMLCTLTYSSFNTESFSYLVREYCRGGGNAQCCSREERIQAVQGNPC